MKLIEFLQKFSVDLKKKHYDDYVLSLKRNDKHNFSGMWELLRINYHNYICDAGEEDLAKILGQYRNSQFEYIFVKKHECIIFILDENGEEYSEELKTIRILNEKREDMIDVNIVENLSDIQTAWLRHYVDHDNNLLIYVTDKNEYYGKEIL